jgi:hypothetical protein
MADPIGITNHSSNAGKHPGAVDATTKKCTGEEIEQEKALKWATHKHKKAQNEKANLQVAELEAVLHSQDVK